LVPTLIKLTKKPRRVRAGVEKLGYPLGVNSLDLQSRIQEANTTVSIGMPCCGNPWFKGSTTTPHHFQPETPKVGALTRSWGRQLGLIPEFREYQTFGQEDTSAQGTRASLETLGHGIHGVIKGCPIFLDP
jgi:hypothetical protein